MAENRGSARLYHHVCSGVECHNLGTVGHDDKTWEMYCCHVVRGGEDYYNLVARCGDGSEPTDRQIIVLGECMPILERHPVLVTAYFRWREREDASPPPALL